MSPQSYVFEVSRQSFPQAVLLNSHKLPVVVEFMGAWSGPCVAQEQRFTQLAGEFPERFIFAKVDIDEQPELRTEYAIDNVPTTLVFHAGEVRRREVGELNDDEARALLATLGIYRQSDALREQAREKHMAGDSAAAILLLTEAVKADPGNLRVALDMVQVLLDLERLADARGLFQRLPENARDSDTGKALKGQLAFAELAAKTAGFEALSARLAATADDHAARFDLAVCNVARHDFTAAMDHLLAIQRQEPEFRDGAAREMIVMLVNMLAATDPPLAADYRRRLSNLLAE